MAITEIVFPELKPGATQDALTQIKGAGNDAFESAGGLLVKKVGSIVRHNGQDVTADERLALAFEWDSIDSFKAFADSPALKEFSAAVKPYGAAPPSPELYEPAAGYDRSEKCLSSGVTLVLRGSLSAGKSEVEAGWSKFVAAVGGDVPSWFGTGIIESSEGKWIGILGYKDGQEIEAASKKPEVVEAMGALRTLAGSEGFGLVLNELKK